MKRLLWWLLMLPVLALAVPVAPINIQSTGAATSATCFQRNTWYVMQCDSAAYVLWGTDSVVVSKTRGASNFGEPVATSEKLVTKTYGDYRCVSVISDSGTVNCTFWREVSQ